MSTKKELFTIMLCPTLYIMGMGLSNYIVYHRYNVTYGDDRYIQAMLPFLAMLMACTLICFLAQRNDLSLPWEGKGKLPLYLEILLPLLAMALYHLITKGSWTREYVTTIVAIFLVGVAEETMFRRILFIRLLRLFQESSFMKPLLISALWFSLLHGVNVLSGSPAPQVLMQLLATFIAGLFYGLMYDYTRSLGLLILMHALWDYILLSGAATEIPLYMILMGVLQVAEIIIMVMLIRLK